MAQALVSELELGTSSSTAILTTVVEARHRRRRLVVRPRRRPEPGATRLEAALMLPGAVVPIAETTGWVVESVHFGAVVALDAEGMTAWSAR